MLPKLNAPTYSLELPSTGEQIKFRPFLVKEQKILLIAQESGEQTQLMDAMNRVIRSCTFNKIGFEDFTNQINELLQFLKIQKAILVGFSLGGLIAAHFASTYTKKIEKLILFGEVILQVSLVVH